MTGYGKAETILESGKLTIEIKSLNGKNADISIKSALLPKDKELTVRQILAQRLQRGNIDLFLTFEANAAETAKEINADLVMSYYRQIMEINNRINSREKGSRFATPAEADSLSKLAGAVRKLETDIGVADCVSVAMRFLSWLRPQDMDAARRFNDLFDAFIKDQARQ